MKATIEVTAESNSITGRGSVCMILTIYYTVYLIIVAVLLIGSRAFYDI